MIPLKSPTTILKISSIDEHLFTDCYFGRCMECGLCHDNCCSYGCPVTMTEVEKILKYKDELEQSVKIPALEWFIDEVEPRTGYLSGKIRRTRVVNNSCVFHDGTSRGCRLHRLALEKGFDPHSIKPLVCFLFPLTWEDNNLYVSEFLEELPCKNTGSSILDTQLDELKCYLGEAFVDEVKRLKAGTHR